VGPSTSNPSLGGSGCKTFCDALGTASPGWLGIVIGALSLTPAGLSGSEPRAMDPDRRCLLAMRGSVWANRDPTQATLPALHLAESDLTRHSSIVTRVDELVDGCRRCGKRPNAKRTNSRNRSAANPPAGPKAGCALRDLRRRPPEGVDEVVMVAAGGLPGLLREGLLLERVAHQTAPKPRRWSGHPGSLARPAPPQPLERCERALVQRLERPRWLAAEQALRSTARGALDPPRGAGRGGVHPLQPGRAVHPRAPWIDSCAPTSRGTRDPPDLPR
jgi:hypothetical protein